MQNRRRTPTEIVRRWQKLVVLRSIRAAIRAGELPQPSGE